MTINNYKYQKPKKIDWLNALPNHWEEVRLGSLFNQRKEKVSDIDFPALSVTKNGVVPQLDNAAKSNDGDNRKLVLKGDFAINSRSDRKGSSGVSIYDGSVSLIYIVLKPIKIEPRYSEYLLKSFYFKEEYYRYGRGIVEDLWTTRYSEMKNMMIPSAPISEQVVIADYLDYKLEKIDRFITKKKQLVSLLTEQKTAIINKAVTKGLEPNAKLKPSGIEWLGNIPEHWEVKPLKYYVSIQGGYAFNSSTFKEKGIQLLKIGNLYMNELHLERQPTFIDNSLTNELPEFLVTNGDILMSLTGTLGKRDYGYAILLKKDEEYFLNQRVAKLSPISEVSSEYLVRVLQSDMYLNELYQLPSGTKQANLSNKNVTGIKVAMPSCKIERDNIINYIATETTKIDKIISTIEQEIGLVEEYKTALIAEAVTGKIDVRDFKTPEIEMPLSMVAEDATAYNIKE